MLYLFGKFYLRPLIFSIMTKIQKYKKKETINFKREKGSYIKKKTIKLPKEEILLVP